MSRHAYLSLATIKRFEPVARARGVSKVARSARGFLTAYKRAGNANYLSQAWDERRRNFIVRHMAQIKARKEPLFGKDGLPTRRHLALIMWAYSPRAALL